MAATIQLQISSLPRSNRFNTICLTLHSVEYPRITNDFAFRRNAIGKYLLLFSSIIIYLQNHIIMTCLPLFTSICIIMQCPNIANNDFRVKPMELPLFTPTPKCSNVHKCPNSTRVIHPQPMKYINEIIIIHVKHILFLTVLIIVFTN